MRWMGLLGSWALLILGLGLASYAVAQDVIAFSDSRKLSKFREIDEMIDEKHKKEVDQLKRSIAQAENSVTGVQSEVSSSEKTTDDLHDSDLVITVSTAENKVYARRSGQLIFETICSTGKNTVLKEGGRTMVFRTPIGRFRIVSKEKDPKWVPPDWHFIEEAREKKMDVIRLERGASIGGLTVSGKNVYRDGIPLPEGEPIYAGGAIVIPPLGTVQRQYPDVLGTHRLNLGDGYALHGTQQVKQLGQSVSHGCVRLRNEDIEHLYEIANVGDEVIIY